MTTLPDGGRRQEAEEMPLGQRLFDNWLLLMIAGILIMVVIYTGWGMYEIATLPQATLP
jgi:hypothetical protein